MVLLSRQVRSRLSIPPELWDLLGAVLGCPFPAVCGALPSPELSIQHFSLALNSQKSKPKNNSSFPPFPCLISHVSCRHMAALHNTKFPSPASPARLPTLLGHGCTEVAAGSCTLLPEVGVPFWEAQPTETDPGHEM